MTASCFGVVLLLVLSVRPIRLFGFQWIQCLIGIRTVIACRRLLMRFSARTMCFIGGSAVTGAAVFLLVLDAFVVGNVPGVSHAYAPVGH
jgi:hypothetical protein